MSGKILVLAGLLLVIESKKDLELKSGFSIRVANEGLTKKERRWKLCIRNVSGTVFLWITQHREVHH